MATVDIKYIKPVRRGRKTYYYFQTDVDGHGYGGKLMPMRCEPGTREWSDRYDELVAAHVPHAQTNVRIGAGERKGALGWVITRFTDPAHSPAWRQLKESTKEVYRRHLDWLRQEDGTSMLAAFDKQVVRGIRNKFLDNPTVGNAVMKRLSQLWIFAEEYWGLNLPANPVREVAKLDVDAEAAWAWKPELFAAYEADANETDLTFYFLARYTGQRKGDCCDMGWSDIDLKGNRIHVVQEKTASRFGCRCIGGCANISRRCLDAASTS